MSLDPRNSVAFDDYLRRRAEHSAGIAYPDPRNQALKDKGTELRWRQAVARLELARARRMHRNKVRIAQAMAGLRLLESSQRRST